MTTMARMPARERRPLVVFGQGLSRNPVWHGEEAIFMGFFRPGARKGMTPMSKTNEWVDGSRTPAQGTRERSLRGGWGAAWGRIARVLAVAACLGWGMGAGGEARGQGLNPEYVRWMQEQLSQGHATTNNLRKYRLRKGAVDKAKPWAKIAETQNTIVLEDGGFGLVPSLIDYSYLNGISISQSSLMDSSTIPSTWDSRTNGWITSIKRQNTDQDDFGTCWAHATMANLETIMRIQNPEAYASEAVPDLSENNLVMQSGRDPLSKSGKNVYNSGGSFDYAMAYLSRWAGPINESEDVYPTPQNNYATMNSDVHGTPVCHVQRAIQFPAKTKPLDHDEIKRAVMKYGMVFVSYFASSPLKTEDYLLPLLAKDGKSFFNWYSRVAGGKLDSNHAVALIGWDDDYPAENFACYTTPENIPLPIPEGNGAYLIKNSWGPESGEDGYFWVSYYDDNMLYNPSYVIPSVESVDNYGDVYYHDSLGAVHPFPYSNFAWAANVFTAKETCEIAAVGFRAMSPGTKYTIYVRTNVDADNPATGTALDESGQSGRTDYAGYVTIPLKKTPSVDKGKRFSVIVKLSSPNCECPLMMEVDLHLKNRNWISYSRSSEATASKGESFVSSDGEDWVDLTTVPTCVWNDIPVDEDEDGMPIYDDVMCLFSTANFCIKAYTKGATPEKSALAGVAIHAVGGTTVASGKTGRFRCDATYENGGKKEGVAAKWSVVKGDEWADIDEDTGVLQAEEVGENHTVTIRAVYTEDGVTVDAKGDVQITAGAPGVPKNVKGTAELDNANSLNATISWDAVSGASKYAVYRGTENNAGKSEYRYTVTATKYVDGNAAPGRKYWYFVKAQNGEGSGTLSSDFSTGVQGWRLLAPPTDVKATTDLTDRIDVSWGASAGATHYRVSRSVAPGGTREVLGEWQTDLRFIDRPAQADTPYYYYVAAALDASGSMAAEGELYAEGIRPSPAVPVLEVRGPDSLGSGEDGDFEAYVTYSKGKADEGPLDVKWSVSEGSVSKNGTKARVTAPKMTSSGKVTVTATHERTGLVGRKDVTVTAGLPGQVTGLKVTSETSAGIGLSWNAAEGAGGYVVARTGGKGGDATFKTAQTAYTDTTAEVGVEYSYTVSAENAAGGGTPSEPVAAFIGLSAPGGVSATGDRSDCVRVKWSGTAGATHFRVGRAASQSGTKTVLGSGWTAERSFDDVPPRDNTEYWYFVKAATGAEGSHATGWSTGAAGRKAAEKTLEGLSVSGPDRVESGESAVYSCLASWSGEEPETTVAAEWSATKGRIGNADGRFQAPSAEADTEVSIVAKYGGMAATQTVTVVGTGVEATAEITKVSAAQRWPFEGLVDIDYTLVTSPSGTKAVIAVSGRDEDHGTTLAATTLEGYGAGGAAVSPGDLRVTWDIGTDYPGLNAASVRVDVTAAVAAKESLPAPVVTVKNATTTNGWALAVSWTLVDGATSYEVWRATSGSFDSATRMTTSTGTNWLDTAVAVKMTYTYWVVARNGTLEGRSEGVQGTPQVDLMPLRSLLTGIEAARPDGVLSDLELEKAMKNPTIGCLDCDLTEISDEEMAVFLWIQRLNQDKDLISNVIKGNYSGISASTLLELFQLSETIRIMTDLTPCVTATQGTGSGALIRVSWGKRSSNILSYEVYRSTTTNGTPTLVATVTTTNWMDTDVVFRHPYWYRVKAVYETLTTGFSGKAKGYWGDWCLPDNNNLMPLRSLLTSIDAVKNLDGVLSETEMNRVMSNSTIIDMDGDPTKISDAEMSIFQRIKTLNQDPALITALIQGDYTYAGMSEAEFLECYSISEAIRALTKY